MTTDVASRTEPSPRGFRGARALRTPGGLSFRLDARVIAVVALLLLAALAAAVLLIGTGDFPISAGDVLVAAGASVLFLTWFEVYKVVRARRV